MENSPCQVQSKVRSAGFQTDAAGSYSLLTLALSHASQMTGISEHVIQSDFCADSKLIIPNFGIDNSTPPLIDTTDDNA